ncbi:type VI secretion system baseplate subunit TssG [Saccharicrinis aurantiacus]|uniref:type VI secretion system baseplate subunit TssG n=1 Tax=Saccharicrinis aurantiacus TaxID=1849719 RepID=UPI0024912B3A|nr:type VI secretion system baseplate subunit TssG [Saccharicrinis aurantiacus]
MNTIDQPNHITANAVDTDYKAETVAARLLSKGISIESVLIKRNGASKRNVSKDIDSIIFIDDSNFYKQIEISTNRSSIYDTMPEGLFHSTEGSLKDKTQEEVLESIREQREEEFYSRRFFQPFEEEIDRSKVLTQFKESSFDKKNNANEFIDIFMSYWPVIKNVNKRRAAIFLEVVPLVPLIRTSHQKIAEAMALIFEMPVKVNTNYNVHHIKSKVESPLGRIKLGENFFTRGDLEDRNSDITIEIGPMSVSDYENFNHEGEDGKMLKCLEEILFPANCKITTKFNLNKTSAVFKLGKAEGVAVSFLGINTILK